jgi:hypothetical protein
MDIMERVQVILEDDLDEGISNTKGDSTQSDLGRVSLSFKIASYCSHLKDAALRS